MHRTGCSALSLREVIPEENLIKLNFNPQKTHFAARVYLLLKMHPLILRGARLSETVEGGVRSEGMCWESKPSGENRRIEAPEVDLVVQVCPSQSCLV